jgi:DNA invertase Pin-like site-specific DNA recombinase
LCKGISPGLPADKKSGKDALRPELKACHAFLDAGDTLVVPSLDRYGRSLQDLINMVAELRERGIGFTSLHENLDTTTPGGRLVFHVFAALAEFIRELIVIGTKEGLAAARARGRVGGRPSVGVAVLRCCTARKRATFHDRKWPLISVGVAGFEPTTSSSRTKRATKLRYTPVAAGRLTTPAPRLL